MSLSMPSNGSGPVGANFSVFRNNLAKDGGSIQAVTVIFSRAGFIDSYYT